MPQKTVEIPTHLMEKKVVTKEWCAWNDLEPPKPDHIHVRGKVLVGNPGVKAFLCRKEPQGINPTILLLDLFLIQQPGVWPAVMTWADASYDSVIVGERYMAVQVVYNSDVIVEVPVKDVH